MERFPYVTTMSVRFRDIDAMGMAHHAVVLTYLEDARTAYVLDLLELADIQEIPYTIARVECDYRNPLSHGETIRVGVRVTSIGVRSFDMDYRIESEDSGELIAEARTVQVCYDYERCSSTELPDGFADRVAAFESE